MRSVTATLAINNLDVTSVEKFFKTQLLPNEVSNTPRSYFAFKTENAAYCLLDCALLLEKYKQANKQKKKQTNKTSNSWP